MYTHVASDGAAARCAAAAARWRAAAAAARLAPAAGAARGTLRGDESLN